jgi:integrase
MADDSGPQKAGKPTSRTRLHRLRAHNNGKFYKKIRGVGFRYFGRWDDPDGADREYSHWVAAHARGEDPPPDPGSITLAELVDRYIVHMERRVALKEIEEGHYADYKRSLFLFLGEVRGSTPAEQAGGPLLDNFRTALREQKKLGGHRVNNTLRAVKAMFRWANEKARLIRVPLQHDHGLRIVALKEIRREHRKHAAEHGEPVFTAGECRVLLRHAGPWMRAAILLALNTGMTQKDLGELAWSDFDLGRRYLNYTRRKKETLRQAVLWKRTVAALVAWRDGERPKPAKPEYADRVFLTRWGNPIWYRNVERLGGDQIGKVSTTDSLSLEFRKLLKRIDTLRAAKAAGAGRKPPKPLSRKRRNFRALRRTFSTFADDNRDKNAKLRVMGHELGGMDAHYVRAMPRRRLKKLADFVRHKLFTRAGARAPGETGKSDPNQRARGSGRQSPGANP